jgi:DNA repair protein SbcC/Rad50
MRLHRLEIDAFGPFAGHELVDFDVLTDSGLFLLCGPTGAGKTSVLDAVCFALFGQVPGERDKAKRLHSDHAPPAAGPRVQLEVTLRGRRLRITRSPEWMRPKKRGVGEIKEPAKALVEERLDGRWQQRTSRIDEAGDLLGSLLGLTMSQFCQVALLPQGSFETFLRCGAQERHALLEKLFGTARFRAVEEWLADHRRALGAESDRHAACVAHILERVAEASGSPRPEQLDPAEVRTWSAEIRTRTLARLADAAESRASADQRVKQARVGVEAVRDLADLQARYREALRRDADLRALEDSTQEMSAHVELARRAATVHPFVQIHDAALSRVREAYDALVAARSGVSPADPDLTGTDLEEGSGAEGAVTAVARHRHEQVTRLEQLLPVQAEIGDIGAEVTRTGDRLAEVSTLRCALARQRDDDERARAETAAAVTEATAAAARVEPLRERVTQSERVARAARKVPALEERRASLATAREREADEAQQTRETWLDLRQARLDGMAAELARDLRDDRPCPVCGSTEHADPAGATARTVSPENERSAELAWQQAEARRHESTERLARCEQELARWQAAADGTDPESADAALAEARTRLAEVETSAARAESLAARLRDLDAATQAARTRGVELDAEHARLTERRALLTRRGTELQATVAAALGDAGTLAERLETARHAARAWDDLLDRLRRHRDAAQAYDTAASRLDAAVAEADLGDVDTVRRALMSQTDLSNAETLLRRRADQAAAVRAVLDDPRIADAAAQPEADTAPASRELDDAERSRDEAVVGERALAHRAERLDTLHRDLQEALGTWAPVRVSLGVAERMASLCAGTSADNRHKMRLSAYVLAARLEQVVSAANDRLMRMSSGRYTLQHSVARGVGDRRGGLGLQVHDGWTGDSRDPATLSGGETFFTSLALALGLSDVVSHEVGGTEIRTLFVDEGFGSLDPDTLDEVMDVLDQLRSGGRAVGLVSHVGDLRARVPTQVHVAKARHGSTLRSS